MFNDLKQLEKGKIRRKLVEQSLGNKKIDNKSFVYFMDIVDDLSACIDLKLGDIEDTSNYDSHALERMYFCGECLLNEEQDDISNSFINQYIDSVIVEYAKFGYEVGLVFFKDKLNQFASDYYNKDIKDYHKALVDLTKSFVEETKKIKKHSIA